MKVTEEALRESGFSCRELQIIKENIEVYGGDLEEAIQYLARYFRVVLWIFYGCMTLFIWICIADDQSYIISAGIGLLISMAFIVCAQPPDLTYKSWRYWRKYRANLNSDL